MKKKALYIAMAGTIVFLSGFLVWEMTAGGRPVEAEAVSYDVCQDATGTIYWDTEQFGGLTYKTWWEDGLETITEVSKQPGGYLYERESVRNGEALFRYRTWLDAEDYFALTDVLKEAEGGPSDSLGWELSYQMAGKDETIKGPDPDPKYGTWLYGFLAWKNEFEMEHENQYQETE